MTSDGGSLHRSARRGSFPWREREHFTPGGNGKDGVERTPERSENKPAGCSDETNGTGLARGQEPKGVELCYWDCRFS